MNVYPLLVDTDVVSFLAKDHPLARSYDQLLDGQSLIVSVITLAEVEFGMELRNWSADRRQKMRLFLDRFTPFSPDQETARIWAQVRAGCQRKGRPIGFADAWIAATAIQLNIPLVSHNAKDYSAIERLTVVTAN